MAPRSSPAIRLAGLVLAAVAVVLVLVLPAMGIASNVLAVVTVLAALVVFVLGVRRLPSGTRAPWWWLVAMAALMTINVIGVAVQVIATGPGNGGGGRTAAAGAMVVVLYGLGVVGLVLMVRRPRPGEGAIVWLDTALIFLAGAAVLSLAVIGPVLDGSVPGSDSVFISLIYPVADLVLLALVVRIAVGGVRGNPSLMLLVAAFALVVVIDSLIITIGSGDVQAATQVRLIHLWVLWCVLMAAAAVAPGAARARVQRPPGDLSTPAAPWRLVVLGAAVLLAPVLLLLALVRGETAAAALLVGITVVAVVVALLRMRALLRVADARAEGGVAQGEARERQRIERDLHDGLQQHLVAMQFQIGALEAQLDTDPAAARRGLEGLRGQAESALDDLRALARGIPPVELERAGVGPALAAATSGLPVAVQVHDATTRRPAAGAENAVYFACLEGIQNQMKHGAPGVPIAVRLATEGDALTFSVGDARAQVPGQLDGADPAPQSVLVRVERAAGEAFALPDDHGGILVLGAVPLGAAT